MSKEALFAARIYPISRFTGEPSGNLLDRYQGLFSEYFDLNVLRGILEDDITDQENGQRLRRACKVAMTELDRAEGHKAAGKNLASVFSRLSLSDEQKDRADFYRYHFLELQPGNAFPCPRISGESPEKLILDFYREMDKLDRNRPKTYESFIVSFERIALQYMWCFAASDFEGEDISLYDYAKVTEAIMSCLESSQREDVPYTMVMGDFSGIQKYIFSIASANYSGVTRRLRARSFFVDIVSKVFSQYVIDCFDVGRANILLQSGGKFYCILPTLADMDERLNRIRSEFDNYLYQMFHGTVSVNMAWTYCGDEGLEQYSDTIVRLNELLGEKKASPFTSVILDENGWREDRFLVCKDLKNRHLCRLCGTELIDADRDSCDMCNMQQEIGSLLPRARFILYERGGSGRKNSYKIFNNYYIRFSEQFSQKEFEEAYLIEALNYTQIPETAYAYPVVRKYMANHVPMAQGMIKTFGEIAETASGTNKLGVLKADVDVLGFLFAQGLKTGQRHFGTISRVNTLSRMLEIYFSGYIEELLEQDPEYSNVYSVFSGGDDLFLIGPWDVMLKLAITIQEKFRIFSAENESVTMSAAITVFGNKEHIALMAEQSEEQLDRAKNELLPEVYPERTGRNAVCVTGQLFTWLDFKEQYQVVGKLETLLQKQSVSVSILRRLAKYSEMYRSFLRDKDIWKLMFEPLLHYDRARNYRSRFSDETNNWFFKEYIPSMENAADYRHVKKNLYFAETMVSIVLNKTSRRRKRE